MTEVYYRYDESSWSNDSVHVFERALPVLRRTPCGVWLDDYGRERFVLDGPGKRYAYPDREAAWESFQIRKRRRVMHLRNQLDAAHCVNECVKDLTLEEAQFKKFFFSSKDSENILTFTL